MTTASPPPRSLGHELWLAGLGWQRAVRRALRAVHLTPTQYLVLDVCSTVRNRERGHLGPNQSQVAERTGLDRQTIHRVVVALERRDLIERGPSFDSHDSWCLALRPSGHQALKKARPLVQAATNAYLARADRHQLETALSALLGDPR